MTKRACAGITKKGTRCKAPPLKDSDFCLAHAEEKTREKAGFGGSQEGAGRPPKPKATEVMKERVEEKIDDVLKPLFDGLTARRAVVVGQGPGAHIEIVDDAQTRIRASESILDRVYGRPKQMTEITGEDGEPLIPDGSLDLSKLDDDDLNTLRTIARRAAAG
jgi:hypothetical protein